MDYLFSVVKLSLIETELHSMVAIEMNANNTRRCFGKGKQLEKDAYKSIKILKKN